LNAVPVLQGTKHIFFAFRNSLQFLAEIEVPGRGRKRDRYRDAPSIKESERSLILLHPTDNKAQAVTGKDFVEDAV